MLVQRTTSLLPSDPRNERRPSSDLWGDPLGKCLLESDGQVQADDENFLVAPVHLPVDGEEPTSVKSIRCQYICSAQSRNLRNPGIAQCIFGILIMHSNLEIAQGSCAISRLSSQIANCAICLQIIAQFVTYVTN